MPRNAQVRRDGHGACAGLPQTLRGLQSWWGLAVGRRPATYKRSHAPPRTAAPVPASHDLQGESTCATYFKSSPVSLSGLAAAPGTAPPGQPAAPPAATPSVPPAPTPAAGPSGASSGGAPSPAQAQSPAPAAGGIPSSPSLPPAQAPEPVPGGSDLSAGVTAGSAVPGPSSDSGPSTGVKIGALVAGVAGGVAVGAAGGAAAFCQPQKPSKSAAGPVACGPQVNFSGCLCLPLVSVAALLNARRRARPSLCSARDWLVGVPA